MNISWLAISYYIYWVVLIYVTFQIIHQFTISSRASAWLFTVYVFPVAGIILYFIFGVKRRKRRIYQQKLSDDQKSREQDTNNQGSVLVNHRYQQRMQQFLGLVNMVYQDGSSQLTAKNKLKLLENGDQKFPLLLSDIEQAQHSIHLEYYIFRLDDVGSELIEVLIKKAKQGLQVRFIFDDYGSSGLNQPVLKRMRSHGVEVWPFAEISLFAFTDRLNYRNHRKIVVIDNQIAYVGGINIGDEYSNNKGKLSKTYWRDSHLRIEGQGVSYVQKIFLNDWNFCAEQETQLQQEPMDPNQDWPDDDNKLIQVIASGPDSPQPIILFSMLQAIHIAQSEILITTPYFIPNPALIKALKIAVLNGVDVRILVPQKSDSKIVNAAAQSFYYELLEVGVKFYKYTKGFIHTKTMVVDGFLSIMGTANFDERSFELNFEINVLIYDEGFAKDLRQSFDNDIKHAKSLSVESWSKRSSLKSFVEKIARLISPIL